MTEEPKPEQSNSTDELSQVERDLLQDDNEYEPDLEKITSFTENLTSHSNNKISKLPTQNYVMTLTLK